MKNVSWFMKYQPKNVNDYVFSDDSYLHTVSEWINAGEIPGNLVMFGPAGTGKTALAEILIRTFIKNQQDLFRLFKRSVKELDDLNDSGWLQKVPISSKRKIVYIEEFDKMSAEAKGTLKDGMMEKFQNHCSFICTTNHFNRIDHALQTRFTYQFNLVCTNVENILKRLKFILDSEGISYDEAGLLQFTTNNIKSGLRDLINTLQVFTVNKTISFDKISLQRSEFEEEIVENTLSIINLLFSTNDINSKRICLVNPLNSIIANQYRRLVEITQYNHNIDYLSIFIRLNEEIHFLPIKLLIDQYSNSIDTRRLIGVHYIAFCYEVMKQIIDINFV